MSSEETLFVILDDISVGLESPDCLVWRCCCPACGCLLLMKSRVHTYLIVSCSQSRQIFI